MWREAKFGNPRAGTTIKALTDRDGNEASTTAKKEEMFRGKSFPSNCYE
jgi:hypothetical protein